MGWERRLQGLMRNWTASWDRAWAQNPAWVRHVTHATQPPADFGAAAAAQPEPLPQLLLVTDSRAVTSSLSGPGTWLLNLRIGDGRRSIRDITRHLDAAELATLPPAEWHSAQQIVLDGPSAAAAAAAGFTPRSGLVVIATGLEAWPAAVTLTRGVATVITLPDNTGWLLTHLAGLAPPAADAPPARPSQSPRNFPAPACHTRGPKATYPR